MRIKPTKNNAIIFQIPNALTTMCERGEFLYSLLCLDSLETYNFFFRNPNSGSEVDSAFPIRHLPCQIFEVIHIAVRQLDAVSVLQINYYRTCQHEDTFLLNSLKLNLFLEFRDT